MIEEWKVIVVPKPSASDIGYTITGDMTKDEAYFSAYCVLLDNGLAVPTRPVYSLYDYYSNGYVTKEVSSSLLVKYSEKHYRIKEFIDTKDKLKTLYTDIKNHNESAATDAERLAFSGLFNMNSILFKSGTEYTLIFKKVTNIDGIAGSRFFFNLYKPLITDTSECFNMVYTELLKNSDIVKTDDDVVLSRDAIIPLGGVDTPLIRSYSPNVAYDNFYYSKQESELVSLYHGDYNKHKDFICRYVRQLSDFKKYETYSSSTSLYIRQPADKRILEVLTIRGSEYNYILSI